ncbi:MAG TPA: hypothetical protein VMR77_02305 [Patescibacteria group bacterium]|jgi:hypothetical protein|nr:hypothetical protein [Patescibacteria group bacterium]
MLEVLGIIGGLFALGSFIPYIRDTLLLKVKPQRATFFIWSVLGAIAFFSQLAKGASNSLWLPGLETFGVLITFILSIKYGIGGFSRRDFIALLIAMIGLIIWYFTKEAAIALYLVIFVDALGLYLTIHKAYISPESETHLAWILSAIGGTLVVISVGSFNIILLSYPVYIVLANLAVIVAIQMGLRRQRK